MPSGATANTLPKTFVSPRLSLVLLGLIAAVLCGWILWLPLYPTQDGPMHLYFVRILEALLLHREPGILPRFYTVKHVLPPYALYYYALIGLNRFVPLVRADQLVICGYVISFLFGFRSLATALGPFGNSVALLAAPLVLNWSLGMGFVNYCLSLSLSFWALGLWCRAAQESSPQRQRARLIGFVLLCFVMMLTHPVPLAAMLGFCALELVVRGMRRRAGLALAPLRSSLVAFLLSTSSMLYVLLFKGEHSLEQHQEYTRFSTEALENAKNFYLLRTLTCFAGHGPVDLLYKTGFLLALVLAAALFFLGRRDSGSSPAYRHSLGMLWMAIAGLLFVLLPLLPHDLNNSHLFTARLVILIWIAVLAAASSVSLSALAPRPLLSLAVPVLGILLMAWTLGIAVQRIDPIAREIARQEAEPTGLEADVVLFLHSQNYVRNDKLSYDPYFWSPVRLLRRSGSVMYNTPWLDLAIIPVGAQPAMPTGRMDSYALESPMDLRTDLKKSAGDRRIMAEHIDAVMVNQGRNEGAQQDAMLPLSEPTEAAPSQWSCQPRPLVELCLDRPGQP